MAQLISCFDLLLLPLFLQAFLFFVFFQPISHRAPPYDGSDVIAVISGGRGFLWNQGVFAASFPWKGQAVLLHGLLHLCEKVSVSSAQVILTELIVWQTLMSSIGRKRLYPSVCRIVLASLFVKYSTSTETYLQKLLIKMRHILSAYVRNISSNTHTHTSSHFCIWNAIFLRT